ncbi:MAG: glycosyltransferase family protein [Deltaproteobacteria bacterium]|nr:glycosyltransferase family protein [Deltaproteobacteria bacterium]
MRILVVVQARVGSSRFPGKVLLPLEDQPLLLRLLERVSGATTRFEMVVATTTEREDDEVASLARAAGYDVFRGHKDDLLDRHFQAARAREADVVVKIPSDCPLIDPAVIDLVLSVFAAHQGEVDFVSNLHPATYPDGHDVEVMSFAALECAWHEAKAPYQREHTTPFIWDQPERFRVRNVTWPGGRDLSMSHRFTIDYPEDYTFISAIYQRLYRPEDPIFRLEEILDLLEAEPHLRAINADYVGVNWYRHHLDALSTVSPTETRTAPLRPPRAAQLQDLRPRPKT